MIIMRKLYFLVLQTTQVSPVTQSTANTSATTTTTTAATSSTTTTNQISSATPPAPGSVEASLLAGQPPGTVIKCVTAQIQMTEGPRIVLQGLQGAEFTSQQLAMVQQQVKQQLLKG